MEEVEAEGMEKGGRRRGRRRRRQAEKEAEEDEAEAYREFWPYMQCVGGMDFPG